MQPSNFARLYLRSVKFVHVFYSQANANSHLGGIMLQCCFGIKSFRKQIQHHLLLPTSSASLCARTHECRVCVMYGQVQSQSCESKTALRITSTPKLNMGKSERIWHHRITKVFFSSSIIAGALKHLNFRGLNYHIFFFKGLKRNIYITVTREKNDQRYQNLKVYSKFVRTVQMGHNVSVFKQLKVK